MLKQHNHITVFEHELLRIDKGEQKLLPEQLKALQLYHGEDGVPFYSLIHNGIRFNEYVGVIQVGNTVIEVLPKSDKTLIGIDEKQSWRDVLIGMLRAVGIFDIQAPSKSYLKLKSNSILDLYFELFIKEVEYLVHLGLLKQYRKISNNSNALKGSLKFDKHIQLNLTHQERFYVRYTTYDTEHKLHFILYKSILLLKHINTNVVLQSRIGALLLQFPEMPDIKITESTFSKLVFNRKTQSYKNAIEIAKLLLLQYHPDLSKGRNDVLALMFDMNKLWEQFVYVSLRKHKHPETLLIAQSIKYFWKPDNGYRSKMIPDIVINKDMDDCMVLDTKWKNLGGYNPSPEDLRQMFVYHEYYNAKKVALVYPGEIQTKTRGRYISTDGKSETDKECSIILLLVHKIIKDWQYSIFKEIDSWMKL